MTRDEAMVRLPEVHRRVLAWVEQGLDDGTVASRLEIDPEAVPPLVEVATSKLVRLMQTPD